MTQAFLDHLTSPYTVADLHFFALCIWIALCIPTVLFWSESVQWLVFMSIYAIIVGHFSAYASSRTEQKVDETLDTIAQ